MSSAVLVAVTTQVVPPPMASLMVSVSGSSSPVSPHTAVLLPPIPHVMAPVPAPPSVNDSARVLLKTRAVSSRDGLIVMLSVARLTVTTKSALVVTL